MKLKSCPFCGHGKKGDILIYDHSADGTGSDACQMRCEWCGARGPEENQREKAIQAWNERNGRG